MLHRVLKLVQENLLSSEALLGTCKFIVDIMTVEMWGEHRPEWIGGSQTVCSV